MAEDSSEKPDASGKADKAKPKPKPNRSKPLFLKQPQMLRVVYALLPILASAIYFFGWRALAVVAVCYLAGGLTERITSRQRKQPMSMALFVTCMLYGLSLPPTVPYYVAIVGIVVAILFGKEVFGGFGRNFVNPAILGRAFVYVCFPIALTGQFAPAFGGPSDWAGGLTKWSYATHGEIPAYIDAPARVAEKPVVDTISQASPMWVYKDVGPEAFHKGTGYTELAWGRIGGIFTQEGTPRLMTAGSMGEGCAILIVLAAVYLLVTKTANWRLMLMTLVGLVVANTLFRNILGFDGPGTGVPPVMLNLLAGTALYVMVFMVTDPVSAPRQTSAQYVYGFIIGFCTVFFRWKGPFVAAASFAVLFGNLLSPLLDIGAQHYKDWQKARAAAAKPVAGQEGGADGS
jgi:Na+-transporting NADH:ubiquinone oxidoreductase subunit B